MGPSSASENFQGLYRRNYKWPYNFNHECQTTETETLVLDLQAALYLSNINIFFIKVVENIYLQFKYYLRDKQTDFSDLDNLWKV